MQKPAWITALALFAATTLHAPTLLAEEPGARRTTTLIKKSSKRDDVQEGESCKTITSYEVQRTEEYQCTTWILADNCTPTSSAPCPQSCSSGHWVVVGEKRGATIKKERVDCHILVE